MKENESNNLQDSYNDEISIIDIFLKLWKKRGKIIAWSIICAVVIVAVGGVVLLNQTKHQVSELGFSLNFKGVSEGRYPNGSRFSVNDIISVVVLRKVYNENNLDKYYKDFAGFQGDISVYRDDFKLVALRTEYASKLSDKKLTIEARDKLEVEFKRKKAGILASTSFKLVSEDSKIEKLPPVLSSKVFHDILRNWIDIAEREKGINKYRISLVTGAVISKNDIENLDYIVGIDLLRETIKTVKGDISKVAELPGAKIVSIKTNKGETNLRDLKFRIDFLHTFELNPLSGAIRTYGITKEGPLSMIYLKTKLYELARERKAILAVRKTYADTLNIYASVKSFDGTTNKTIRGQSTAMGSTSTIIPQFDGNFFDKIVSMAQQDVNVKYRQELTNSEISAALESINLDKEISYYTTLFEAFKKFREKNTINVTNNKGLVSVEALINKKQIKIMNSLTQIIKDTHTFYQKINKYSINPQSQFYRVSSFTSVSINTISEKKMLMIMILLWIFCEAVIIGRVLLGNKIPEIK